MIVCFYRHLPATLAVQMVQLTEIRDGSKRPLPSLLSLLLPDTYRTLHKVSLAQNELRHGPSSLSTSTWSVLSQHYGGLVFLCRCLPCSSLAFGPPFPRDGWIPTGFLLPDKQRARDCWETELFARRSGIVGVQRYLPMHKLLTTSRSIKMYVGQLGPTIFPICL